MDKFYGPYKTAVGEFCPPLSDMDRETIYLSNLKHDDETPWCASYICPCGCGREVYLPLRPKENGHPSWEYEIHLDNTVSFTPSILGKQGTCQSHYFIKNGLVQWA